MKTYKETDNLSELRVGDRLEMNDGSLHKVVKDTHREVTKSPCFHCSFGATDACITHGIECGDFHFKQLTK